MLMRIRRGGGYALNRSTHDKFKKIMWGGGGRQHGRATAQHWQRLRRKHDSVSGASAACSVKLRKLPPPPKRPASVMVIKVPTLTLLIPPAKIFPTAAAAAAATAATPPAVTAPTATVAAPAPAVYRACSTAAAASASASTATAPTPPPHLPLPPSFPTRTPPMTVVSTCAFSASVRNHRGGGAGGGRNRSCPGHVSPTLGTGAPSAESTLWGPSQCT